MRVVDASALASALTDGGADGRWSTAQLKDFRLAAPHLLPAEVANVLRRAANAGRITADTAAQAYGDLLRLRVELYPFAPFAPRVWELKAALTTSDAWYVALAESLGAALVTLDGRLACSHGPRCAFITPDETGKP